MKKVGTMFLELLIPVLMFLLLIPIDIITFWFYDEDNKYILNSELYVCFMQLMFIGILILVYRYVFRIKVKKYFKIDSLSWRKILCLMLMVPGYYVLTQRLMFILCKDSLVYESSNEILTYGQIIIYSLPAITVSPILEEVSIRLGMVGYAKSKFGKIYSLLLSSIIFSLLHKGNKARDITLFMDALLMGSVLLITGCIIYSILIHLCLNWFIFILSIADKFASNINGMEEGYLGNGNYGVVLVADTLFWGLIAMSLLGVFLLVRGERKN